MAKQKSRKPPPPSRSSLRMDPDTDWNKVPNKASDAIAICDDILIELEGAPLSVWQAADRSGDYFTRTEKTVKDMKDKFEDGQVPTDKQMAALRGWLEGVRKWTKPKNKEADHGEDDE